MVAVSAGRGITDKLAARADRASLRFEPDEFGVTAGVSCGLCGADLLCSAGDGSHGFKIIASPARVEALCTGGMISGQGWLPTCASKSPPRPTAGNAIPNKLD